MSATPRVANKLVPPHRFAALAAMALAFLLALPAAARGDAGGLDIATLRVRLKETPAIGLVGKLRLKGEIEDLIGDLAAFHAGRANQTLDTLHARYRGLVARVVQLLEEGDTALAHDLATSTDHLWATLTNPGQFASLASS